MTNRFEHDVDRLAQEVIDANPGSAVTAAYRAVAMDLFSKVGAAVSAPPQPRCEYPKAEAGPFWHELSALLEKYKAPYLYEPLAEAIFRNFFAAAPAQPETSRTYGELPGSIRNMVEPHEWDNKNISEQRDYALDMVDFLERELGNFRRNQTAAQEEQPVENSPQKGKP